MKTLLAGAAFAATLATAGNALAADTIRMLAPTWLGFAPVHVANDLGCFKEEGLEVDYKFEDDRTNVLAAYARGDIDVDMRTVGEHQGRPRDASTPGVIIGTIDESVGGDGVITDEAIKSVADLKGKTIAAEPNIPARLLMQMELKKAGMTLADLQIKDIATADTAAVFADSSIAAIATYEPFMSQAVKASTRPGARVFFSSKDYPGIIVDIITARREDLAANPKKYASFLKCIYKAIDYSKAEPDKYAELAAGHFAEQHVHHGRGARKVPVADVPGRERPQSHQHGKRGDRPHEPVERTSERGPRGLTCWRHGTTSDRTWCRWHRAPCRRRRSGARRRATPGPSATEPTPRATAQAPVPGFRHSPARRSLSILDHMTSMTTRAHSATTQTPASTGDWASDSILDLMLVCCVARTARCSTCSAMPTTSRLGSCSGSVGGSSVARLQGSTRSKQGMQCAPC